MHKSSPLCLYRYVGRGCKAAPTNVAVATLLSTETVVWGAQPHTTVINQLAQRYILRVVLLEAKKRGSP